MFRASGEGNNLESLQRDSWQLELLVTGFALAGMLSGYEQFGEWCARLMAALTGADILANFGGGMVITLLFSYLVTLINFFFHVVIRCLWIGAIGSRSVMGSTVVSRRKYAAIFNRFLVRRTGNFDRYITRLDDAASLIFAFTFLLVAASVSFVTTILGAAGITSLVRWLEVPMLEKWVMIPFMVVYLLFALIYLIDFLTASYFKRFRWFAYLYYPFYRFFGWLTLARLYRPLYYNLLNRRGGRRLVFLLIPYLAICLILLTVDIFPSSYIAEDYFRQEANSALVLNREHYADEGQYDAGDSPIVVPSQIIRKSPLRVRMPLLPDYNEYIAYACPDLPPQYATSVRTNMFSDGRRGFYDGAEFRDSSRIVLNRATLKCLARPIALALDGEPVPLDGALLANQAGSHYAELVVFIALDSLEQGLHELQLTQLHEPRESTPLDTVHAEIRVPFYYAPASD